MSLETPEPIDADNYSKAVKCELYPYTSPLVTLPIIPLWYTPMGRLPEEALPINACVLGVIFLDKLHSFFIVMLHPSSRRLKEPGHDFAGQPRGMS